MVNAQQQSNKNANTVKNDDAYCLSEIALCNPHGFDKDKYWKEDAERLAVRRK